MCTLYFYVLHYQCGCSYEDGENFEPCHDVEQEWESSHRGEQVREVVHNEWVGIDCPRCSSESGE